MKPATYSFSSGSFRATPTLAECLDRLQLNPNDPASFPFIPGDTTAGTENELQVAVAGSRQAVDLPATIEHSNYFANLIRRARTGDTSHQAYRNLERYLSENKENLWENSWVRFPMHRLNEHAREILNQDLRGDKTDPDSLPRNDVERFFFRNNGECWLRIPISYLLKLSLADLLGSVAGENETLQSVGARLLDHFLSDNTSPETFSFHVLNSRVGEPPGKNIAAEVARRYLFSHLLLLYANKKFGLEENGQKAVIFFSPHPPVRQRYLNENISDAFYRELFMSPCLSGWNDGENKHRYMELCHQVLSRSHLNSVMKMREAGIITNNLVVLPHTSNISLANNGTHLSMGSKKLTALLSEPGSGFDRHHEKYLGDLVAKTMEHFLPLFVGTYSAAPYRLDYDEFHPEKVLGFLPHQLDYTHLRMLWRRWKKKAKNKVFGHALTPFGPQTFDRFVGKLFQLKGDFVPDFRLVDYPVSLLSTESNCCQDGTLGNDLRLKEDLHALGVFDKSMAVYLPYRLRQFAAMGYSGFEARHFSLFSGLTTDLARAADLQMLLYALAYKYIASGIASHEQIPGEPFIESERRQIFFGAAGNIPTFFVRKDTRNLFLARILRRTKGIRASRRYHGYLRVYNREYCQALLEMIREDGADLIEMLHLQETMDDLGLRLAKPEIYSACGKLVQKIVGHQPSGRKPTDLTAAEFNTEAERYYRQELRLSYLAEAWQDTARGIGALADAGHPFSLENRKQILALCGGRGYEGWLSRCWHAIAADNLGQQDASRLLRLMLFAEDLEAKREKNLC